jgi:hypothetical protein
MSSRLKPGGRPFLAALAFLVMMLVAAGTPIVWALTGRQSESYPELIILGIGVPIGIVLTLAAGARFWFLNRSGAARRNGNVDGV